MTDGAGPSTRYGHYMAEISADIAATIERLGCQPILFVGSGLSRRYFSGPSWDELLAYLAKTCPLIDKDYAYYKQTLKSPLVIGQEFARLYQEWAWSSGKTHFPKEMFTESVPAELYVKPNFHTDRENKAVDQYLTGLGPA